MQEHFHFDPAKAAAQQAAQAQANALAAKAAREVPPPKRPIDTPPRQQPKPSGLSAEGDIGVRNSSGRSGSYYLPPGYKQKAVPLAVLLHGTGGSGAEMVDAFRPLAAKHGFAIVAPDSRKLRGGVLTWEVGDQPDDITEDLAHTMKCVRALQSMPGVHVDSQRTLIAGYSGGGSSAPYIASHESFFRAFAVLHGGIIPGGFANNRVRGWFSAGDSDPARPVAGVRRALEQLKGAGWDSSLELKTFPGGHELSEAEQSAVIEWWLGK
jgi:poly(3-hydroxybutyrate) depolymerase